MEDKALSQAALNLRNAAPDQWEKFVYAVEHVVENVGTIDLLQTKLDLEVLQHRQGWARGVLWLLRSFKECDGRVGLPTADHHRV